MAETKTKPTSADVDAFLDTVEPAAKRSDARKICAMMARLSGEPPVLWGPSIIGFGSYHYRYASGHEGDAPRIGFSPRSTALVLYLSSGFPGYDALMARFGKHKASKACLYVKKLADIDETVLEELVRASIDDVRERYPEGA